MSVECIMHGLSYPAWPMCRASSMHDAAMHDAAMHDAAMHDAATVYMKGCCSSFPGPPSPGGTLANHHQLDGASVAATRFVAHRLLNTEAPPS